MASPQSHPPEVYNSAILHEPVNIDPDGPVARVKALLAKKIRLSLQDGRVLIGNFSAYDKFGNFVLTDADEFFGDLKRELPMVIVPLTYVSAAEIGLSPATA
jgi:small nuclear ribonucleoprotein (snRNP)-like protein